MAWRKNLLVLDEVAVLKRGPTFCCRRILCRERFLIDMEKCYCKIRWSERDKDPEDKDLLAKETEEERKERERVERAADDEAVRNLLVFDQDTMEVDYRKKRATSCKHYTNVILPMTLAQEQEIECRRIEWMKVFNDFMN